MVEAADSGKCDDLPRFELEDHEHVERLESDGLDREEIDADDAFGLVAKEGPPALGSQGSGLRSSLSISEARMPIGLDPKV